MEIKVMKRGFFNRILGRPATGLPSQPDCWTQENGTIRIDLAKAPELAEPGGALRIEDEKLDQRVLVVHGMDGSYHAFANSCTHGGRRLDPVPGTGTVQCCSVGHSTFDYQGKLLAGMAKEDITRYACSVENGMLTVDLA
ncbi:MAG: Rieske (2Fe-2S) protein [Desulfovibrio sp.]|nr:MAG: Rieske (2Fe-2S) protein [Desulfovibrio sp.]